MSLALATTTTMELPPEEATEDPFLINLVVHTIDDVAASMPGRI
jgi:hypothetical protein